MNHRSSIFTLHWTSDSSSVGKDFRSNQPVIPFSVTKLPTATMATPPAPVKNNPSSPQNLRCMTDPELQKVFDQFDADGDGRISLPELSQVLSSLGSRSSSADLRLAMAEIDSDGDGFISLPEFSAFCRSGSSSSASSNEAELREAFCIYDEDRNGLISVRELQMVMNRLNMKCTMGDCERMVKSVDSDGDGNVNFEEFKKMMTRHP